ncbi:MAG: hypothetical protein KDD02_11840 [Phaeodactylibacter sp.]|nr:hypothetical protein [Phaeodactylibacter sp.]MCB9300284.1 hypothetical protein [Lewinellaceae bacterium]
MNWKLLIGALIIIAGAAFWILSRQEGVSASDKGKVNLSYNICLKADAGYRVLDNDTLARVFYAQNYWADSTGQYFSKTLLSPSGDTLFASVFNNASLRRAEEALQLAGFENIQENRAKNPDFTFQIALARRPDGVFFLRRLINDPQFQVVAMVDQFSRDSAALARRFETDQLIQSIEKCL